MPAISLQWDPKELAVWLEGKTEAAVVRAVSKAGGDALRFLRAGSSRLIRSRKRFKVSRVNKAMTLRYPRGVRSIEELVWHMDVKDSAMPIADLPNRQVRRGVSVAVNTSGRKLLAQAFIARMKSGHTGVFLRAEGGGIGPLTKRQTKLGQRLRVGRLPIQEVFTSRISDVFADDGFLGFVGGGVSDKFAEAFGRLLPLELQKAR